MMKQKLGFLCLLALFMSSFLFGCTPSQDTMDLRTTEIAANIFATQTAVAPITTPTPTNTPTATPQPTSTPTPTATPIDPRVILQQALDTLAAQKSFVIRQNSITEMTGMGLSIEFEALYNGTYLEPDKGHGVMIVRAFGETNQQEIVVYGDTAYTRYSDTTGWVVMNEWPAIFDGDVDTEIEVNDLESLVLVEETQLAGESVYHLKGMVKNPEDWLQDVLENQLTVSDIEIKEGSFEVHYWVDVANSFPRQIVMTGQMTVKVESDDLLGDMTMDATLENTTSFTKFDEPVTINVPETLPGTIAFSSNCEGDYDIFVMNADGSRARRLTRDFADDFMPDWSPDGEMLAYVNHDVNSDIYTMTFKGTNVKQITTDQFDEESPDWSPDGTKIVFDSNRGGDWDIYVMNPDGSGQMNLSQHSAQYDIFPDWSPDGTQIAFMSDRTGNGDIYVMTADGSNQTRLTYGSCHETYPMWAPSGDQIVFEQWCDENVALVVMNADGSDLRKLPIGEEEGNWLPSWSPDGKYIVFATQRYESNDIYVIEVASGDLTRLTQDTCDEFFPVWRPENWSTLSEPDMRDN